MNHSCRYCGRVHKAGEICPRAPKRGAQATKQGLIRNTYRWQKTRSQVLERDKHLCRYCLTQGRITTDCLQVHHIIPLEEQGAERTAYSEDWLITLCSRGDSSCHAKAERGEIARADLHRLAMSEPTWHGMPKKKQTAG